MSNFVTDNGDLPAPKSDLNPLDSTKKQINYVIASDWNITRQAILDTKDYLRGGASFYGLTPVASDPAPAGITNYVWLKNDATLWQTVGGVATQIGAGGTSRALGVPVTTSRQWTTGLAPRAGGGWNFIAQSYNYPFDVPTEWKVAHLEAGTTNTYYGPIGVYANSNFQIPSVGTAVVNNNQLRAPDGTIFFICKVDGTTVYVHYYDPIDEQIKLCATGTVPTGNSFCYSAIFNHDGTKLYIGTQSDTIPCVLEVDVATKAIRTVGSGGSATAGFQRYAYYLVADAGPGSDWVYFACGQSGWQLVALRLSTGVATTLYTTTAGFQFMQLSGDTTSCRALIYDNGGSTNYYIFDGTLSASPPSTTRDATPFTNPLVIPPDIDWSNGVGKVLYREQPFYQVLTPTAAGWTAVLTAAAVSKSAPSSIWQMQDTSGNLLDTGGASRSFVPTTGIGPSYANSTLYWGARKSIHLTEAQANRFTATVANANANSILVAFYVQIFATPTTTRSVIETDGGYAEATTLPAFKADANTPVAGTANAGSTWHVVWVSYNRGASTFKVITDQEVITAGYFSGSGTNLILGGSAGSTTAPMNVTYGAAWFGTAAEWTTAEIQAVTAALGWSAPLVTPTWVEVDYTVTYTAPITLESLVTLPLSGQPLTNGQQYGGFATRTGWHGAWAGGPSQPRSFKVGSTVYFCGYPDGVLYSYTETKAWAPDGTISGNPSLLGAYSSGTDQGMKYPYFNRYNSVNDRIYCSGRRERDHDGCSLGYFSRSGGTFSSPFNTTPLDQYRAPAGLVVIESLGYVVFSGTLFDDSTTTQAQLLVYDTAFTLVHQWNVTGTRNTGNIFLTSNPQIVMGIDANAVAYRINITTGALVQTKALGTFDVGPTEQLNNSFIYITLDKTLYQLNTDTLERTQIAPIGFTPTYLASAPTGSVYMTNGTQLYVLPVDS